MRLYISSNEIYKCYKAIINIRSYEQQAQTPFNSVLGNLYRDGEDYMGWHQDNEPELGHQPVIASLSFGATRQFVFKHKITKEKIAFQLTPGSLLIMAGDTQQY
ncbi:alkylated DNA repair protein [Photobacterium leiognathi lrivu.4.1]|uniref:Alkylated DNA repair protein n=1 Tax=Photobacterium leiognathi lrivu.4.1 TaxID=1248232 RepID=X0P808_PHOLE|nr:alkylated DNA repair protein [Photobacterium leiognathi lrivu.4.1]